VTYQQYHGDTVSTIMSVQCSNISKWFTSRNNQLLALNLCFFWCKGGMFRTTSVNEYFSCNTVQSQWVCRSV